MLNQRFLGRLRTFGTPKQHQTIMFQQHSKEESRIPWSFLDFSRFPFRAKNVVAPIR
jgi:hypothetical protein